MNQKFNNDIFFLRLYIFRKKLFINLIFKLFINFKIKQFLI